MIASEIWLDREVRRREAARRICWQCGRVFPVPKHLFGVQRLCDACETPEQQERITEAATEWRRAHTLSPLIDAELEREDAGTDQP
jgi:hypothetical protein